MTEYPILQAFVQGQVDRHVEKHAMATPKYFSVPRAREVGAAHVWKLYMAEWERLEANATQANANPEDIDLYDTVVIVEDQETIQARLVALTGTRTLLEDLEDV